MVRQVLHDYVRTLQVRFGRLPVRVQRRLTAEVVAHLEERMATARDQHPDWSEDEVADSVIHAFCDPNDVDVAYGPEGGIVRASTGEVVMRSGLLTVSGEQRSTFRWNGMAAAGSGMLIVLAAATVFLLQPAVLFGGEAPTFDDAPRAVADGSWEAWDASQNFTFEVTQDQAPFALTIDITQEAGCVDWILVGPGGEVRPAGACGDAHDTVQQAAAGQWRLEVTGTDFTGSVHATVVSA